MGSFVGSMMLITATVEENVGSTCLDQVGRNIREWARVGRVKED